MIAPSKMGNAWRVIPRMFPHPFACNPLLVPVPVRFFSTVPTGRNSKDTYFVSFGPPLRVTMTVLCVKARAPTWPTCRIFFFFLFIFLPAASVRSRSRLTHAQRKNPGVVWPCTRKNFHRLFIRPWNTNDSHGAKSLWDKFSTLYAESRIKSRREMVTSLFLILLYCDSMGLFKQFRWRNDKWCFEWQQRYWEY